MSTQATAQFMQTPAGAQLHRWEAEQMDRLMARQSGEAALQIGDGFAKALRSAPIGFKLCVESDVAALPLLTYQDAVVADPVALPFAQDTFDVVLLHHALASHTSPLCVLKEAIRVLAPGGRLVILEMNPWGPWYVRRKAQLLALSTHFQPVSVPWVKNSLAGAVTLDRGRFGVYSLSLSDNPNTLAKWSWMEKAGDRWWPSMANAYMLSGIKTEQSLSLVGKITQECEKFARGWVKTPVSQAQLESNKK